MDRARYRAYSQYLREKYRCKVYKLPLNIPVTCPNRDGNLGTGGCAYCGDVGAGFESLSSLMPVRQQLSINMEYIRRKYNAEKFIAYFQNYSNTYLKPATFKEYLEEACMENIVEIYVSTRPDCVTDEHLDAAAAVRQKTGVGIAFEFGLQTVNYHSLINVNRGHTLAEFIDAVIRTKANGFDICAHVILDLPWDHMTDAIENAKVLSALRVDQVKLHSLYIVKGTAMAEGYLRGEIVPVSMDEYIARVVAFLEHLDPAVVIQRLISRAPAEHTLHANWDTSWWKVRDRIEEYMARADTWQGKRFDYLGGKAIKKGAIECET
jgi:radical SAM protein (TIGR01212 family)